LRAGGLGMGRAQVVKDLRDDAEYLADFFGNEEVRRFVTRPGGSWLDFPYALEVVAVMMPCIRHRC
jgi:hypothetical protein